MVSYLQQAADYYNYILEEQSDQRLKGWPFMDSPLPIISVILLYYYFIKYAGPKLMEKRKPFDIRRIMIYYNSCQCVVNVWATIQGVKLMMHPTYSMLCSPITRENTPYHMKMTFLSYLYFIVKVVDLLDTVFMVLRKNYRQVTFLHVYHHIGMAFGCWIVVKFIPGAHLSFVGCINCFVHSIMYFYYLLTAYNKEAKKSVWWKKHLTELQLVQFTLVFLHHFIALVNPYCSYPKIPLLIFMSQNLLIVYLFSQFYYESYIKTNKKKV